MKRVLQIVAAAVVALTATGCFKTEVREVVVEEPNIKVLNYTIYNNDWQWDEDRNGYNGHFYCNIQCQELSNYICNYGSVTAYLVSGGQQEILPATIWLDDGFDIWEQVINFNFAPGRLSFYFANSDFMYPTDGPGRYDFRVVLMW